MTTILALEGAFIAGDAAWVSQLTLEHVHCLTRKHVIWDGKIVFFSGDEIPILLAQAGLIRLLSDEQYDTLVAELDERDEIGVIALTEEEGLLIDTSVGDSAVSGALLFTGSGGYNAATYYQNLEHDVISERISAAMQLTFQVDPQSGGMIHKKVWPEEVDTLSSPNVGYLDYLQGRMDEFHRTLKQFKAREDSKLPRSENRTAPAPNAPKATPERMKAILTALRKKSINK
ncbi:hypothetical protein KP803_09945 [Vibrio sp. ZSDE26]|uniref:Uncharacterized protein n=1 Tax=Vibrio amylolyticus TaxID=2847292 RepID=A0A9X1XI26_9VIBR|nr:hypothetical protein [Vibrio amylolyticus]MCK6263592.1 hypothetical protein [Vibrio amylolyticus]